MKYYFFRDTDHEGNTSDNLSYYAAGIVKEIVKEKPCSSGKDITVFYLNPFTLEPWYTWRAYSEVILMETTKEEWEYADRLYQKIKKIN